MKGCLVRAKKMLFLFLSSVNNGNSVCHDLGNLPYIAAEQIVLYMAFVINVQS